MREFPQFSRLPNPGYFTHTTHLTSDALEALRASGSWPKAPEPETSPSCALAHGSRPRSLHLRAPAKTGAAHVPRPTWAALS